MAAAALETVTPEDPEELKAILGPKSRYRSPFRPRGSGSASTDCNTSTVGTIIDMSAMNRIGEVDVANRSITVQAGARISDVVAALAEVDMQLDDCYDLPQHTVGGAVAGGCVGQAMKSQGAFFSSQAIGLKVITPLGRVVEADIQQPEVLNMLRLSFGMLGVIHEVTLRIRPLRPFSAAQKTCSFEQFAAGIPTLVRSDVGLRFSLQPFRDRVFVSLRRFDDQASPPRKLPWKLKTWSESRALPAIGRGLQYVLPVPGLRHSLVDKINGAAEQTLGNRLVGSGDAVSVQAGRTHVRPYYRATWMFPTAGFGEIVKRYAAFCREVQEDSGFRCDQPTVGYLVRQDQSAALSPSFDQDLFSLTAVSTTPKGWQDFTIDYGEFARQNGGTPLFNLSPEAHPHRARAAYGKRMDYFRNLRRQTDPDNRLMNPFLSRYFL